MDFLRVLALLVVCLASPVCASNKPNVVFIMADDLCTALSGYGHPQCKTPNLDRLAAKGTTFTRAYCQYPLCGPSRASIMSGMYPITNGVTGNGGMLKVKTPTLPELLRQNGYWTGRCGKIYHMGVPGNIFTGAPGTDHMQSWDVTRNVQVMETLTPGKAEDVMHEDSTPFYDRNRENWKAWNEAGKGGVFRIDRGNHQGSDMVIVEATVPDLELADGFTATKAIELLRERAADKKPFFLGVGFVRPHVPFVAPTRSFKDYGIDKMKLPKVPEGDLEDLPKAAKQQSNANKYQMNELDQRKSLRGYYASVSYMDEQVGRVIDALDELGLRSNTIVVFVSDHGFHLGEHTLWQKQSLMEESARVPLIISLPGDKKGVRSSRVVELIDLYPTLGELAGLKAPKVLQGQSLVNSLGVDDTPYPTEEALTQVPVGFALRTPDWAFMRYGKLGSDKAEYMLYDMQKDPKQFNNLADDPEYKDQFEAMKKRLAQRVSGLRKSSLGAAP